MKKIVPLAFLIFGVVALADPPSMQIASTWPAAPAGVELSQAPSPPGADGVPGQYPGGINSNGWPINSINPDVPVPAHPYISSLSLIGDSSDFQYDISVIIKIVGLPNTTYSFSANVWDIGTYTQDDAPCDEFCFTITTRADGTGSALLNWCPVLMPTSNPSGWNAWFRMYCPDGTQVCQQAICCYL